MSEPSRLQAGHPPLVWCACAAAWWMGVAFAAGAAAVNSNPAATPKYAPDRKIDILHLLLDVTPDFQKSTVSGEATLTFKPIAKPLENLRLDAVDLTVSSVSCTAPLAGYQATDEEIVATFAPPVPPGTETRLTVRYSAHPAKGLYFRTPAAGYPAGDTHVWSQGESIEARHWFPSYDHPNEKFTSEVICRVPAGMRVLSNGVQVSSAEDPASGLVAVRWLQDKPHANYLITLVAGSFTTLEDTSGRVPLRFHTLPSDANEAALTFMETKPALEFFEREIGLPYPWAQYGQVTVRDFHWGGMENTTLTTLTDQTLHQADTETLTSSEELVAHELVHQWFGNYVTCKDWSHVWLNEGFATYYTHLYRGHRHGREEFLYGLHQDAEDVLANKGDSRPIQFRGYDTPREQFDYRSYPKGGWVLHMLRSQLGDDLFRRCIRTYLERHPFGTVVTEDLNEVVEELSGRSFDRFFDQWVYHARQPELDVNYGWDARTRLAKVSIRQAQPASEAVMLFEFPLTLRFKSAAGTVDHRVQVTQRDEDFYVPLPQAPEIVRVDPECTVLADIRFEPPTAMLYAQLADLTDLIGRLRAARQLSGKPGAETVARLKQALNSDPFHGVRVEAAKSLRKIHTEEALDALAASAHQADARTRKAVVTELAGFFHPRALEALRARIGTERNPIILAAVIKGLAPYPQPAVHDTLLRFLGTESFRGRLADAAVAAMRTRDDPAFLGPLQEALTGREQAFTSSGFADALDALAFLARNEKSRDGPREFITGFLQHRRQRVQLAAIRALGTLGDPRAISRLETFASSRRDPQQKEAEQAIAALRAVNRPADNLRDLRQELLDVKKENQRLSRELADLKKRVEAGAAANAPKTASPSQGTPSR